MSVYVDAFVNPTPAQKLAESEGGRLNVAAFQARNTGNLQEAERLYLLAIAVKERGLGVDAMTTALSRNRLGEVHMLMGKFAEAEDNLGKALEVRRRKGNPFDCAVTRENLAQVYEARGHLTEAREMRLEGEPDRNIVCGNYQCQGQSFGLDKLNKFSQCKELSRMYKMERYWSPSYLVPPRNMFANIQFNPTPSAAMATFEGIDLNNQAYQAKVRGDFTEAERLYLRAIEVKERHLGPSAITTALSRNALGEVYLQMGRMAEAEDNLTKALEVRNAGGPPFDAAVTRENLAQLAEMRGRMSDAKALRLAGAPNTIACANSDCISQALSLDALKQCSTCKSVYYCSEACQIAKLAYPMFSRPTTLIAAVVAILFAQTSLAAVVYRAPSDSAQLLDADHGFDARSETFNPSNNTQLLEARKGRGGAGDIIGEAITGIITGIQDGINKDKEARSRFTQDLVGKLHAQHPNFNWIACHTKHDTKFDGKRGVDWDHRHQEFDVKIGGTIGYEIYNAKSGKFFRKGDGGYLNWAYIGKVLKTENNGKDITFGKP
ncbi:hypothetical protein EYR36_005612 [Pleurotus pulmonarius]|nr:hypothetical protein EYR36_005612 [Pleurotus pulmonarius]